MKFLSLTLICFSLLLLLGCGSGDKSKILEQYKYDETHEKPTAAVQSKFAPWVKEGVDCYGIVVVYDDNTKSPLRVKEIHVKITAVGSEKIRVASLENIIMSQVKGCNKYSVKVGEVGEETGEELFQTREEAIKYIVSKYPDLRMK